MVSMTTTTISPSPLAPVSTHLERAIVQVRFDFILFAVLPFPMDTFKVIVHHQQETVHLPDPSDLLIMSMESVDMLVLLDLLVGVVVIAMTMKEGDYQSWISRLHCLVDFIGMGELWLVAWWKEKDLPVQ